jgi:hypothetical protein
MQCWMVRKQAEENSPDWQVWRAAVFALGSTLSTKTEMRTIETAFKDFLFIDDAPASLAGLGIFQTRLPVLRVSGVAVQRAYFSDFSQRGKMDALK